MWRDPILGGVRPISLSSRKETYACPQHWRTQSHPIQNRPQLRCPRIGKHPPDLSRLLQSRATRARHSFIVATLSRTAAARPATSSARSDPTSGSSCSHVDVAQVFPGGHSSPIPPPPDGARRCSEDCPSG